MPNKEESLLRDNFIVYVLTFFTVCIVCRVLFVAGSFLSSRASGRKLLADNESLGEDSLLTEVKGVPTPSADQEQGSLLRDMEDVSASPGDEATTDSGMEEMTTGVEDPEKKCTKPGELIYWNSYNGSVQPNGSFHIVQVQMGAFTYKSKWELSYYNRSPKWEIL